MGEIKSTIELAMERTRHLVAGDAAPAGLSGRQRRDRVLPLVRRLLHGDLGAAQVPGAVATLSQEHPGEDWAAALARECARALVPGENDGVLLPALESLDSGLAAKLAAAVDRVRREQDAASEAATARLAADLALEGIRGSAVVPNPAAAPGWRQQAEERLARFAAARDELLGGER